MRKQRELANKRLKLHDQQYAIGDLVWLWDSERMKQLDRKFSPFWNGPWRIESQHSRSLWEVRSLDTRRWKLVHSDFLQLYI